MFHRGPDGSGEFLAPNVMLAMRRLSIIDIAGGNQPLYNEDKSLVLVANGEVYNHVELRDDLRKRGHVFATRSDCETILHLYEEYGQDCVHHLRGMFAFAVWDINNKRLLLARDRMGEKPLYLFQQGDRLFFASELRALLATGLIPFDLEPAAINEFFHFGYVPEPRTPIRGIRKLPAGNLFAIDTEPFTIKQKCYWRLEDAPPVHGNPPTLIREELDRIGELVTRADVPVGVALSGGLDSSVVAAIAASAKPGNIHALTLGYEGRPHQDERSAARVLADALNMPFHEVEVRNDEVISFFPERAYLRDDPIADIAGHNYWAVSRLSRDCGIPVLLKGHGGDELFWGYKWVVEAVQRSQAKADGETAFGEFIRELKALMPANFSRAAIRRFAYRAAGPLFGWRPFLKRAKPGANQLVFYDLTEEFQIGEFARDRIFTDHFVAQVQNSRPEEVFRVPRPWKDIPVLITRLICDTYLVENGMAQGDRLSMANSVELRLPLCDYRLAELVVGLRKARPDHHLEPKTWLRQAMRSRIPAEVMNRPKRGFTPPGQVWLEGLLEKYGSTLTNGFLVRQQILHPDAARFLSRQHSRFSAWPELFYKCLILEYWCRGVSALLSRSAPQSAGFPPMAA